MQRLKKILNKLNYLKKPIENKTKKSFNKFYFIKYFIFLFFGFFLLANIIFSQNLSEIFFGLVNFEKKSVINFLEKIRQEKNFFSQLKFYENIYGKEIKDQVFQKENEKKQMIKKLEQVLKKNPKSRDILYSIFLLTNDEKYLQQAKAVDPEIGE